MNASLPDSIDFSDVSGNHVLVALSGGADSTALLVLLCSVREKLRIRLTAAHYNHGIRGESADLDERFCRELCARLDVPLLCGHGDVPRFARDTHTGLESAARDARYGFLYETRKSIGADWIALAHHLGDQSETVLMHLFRGTGPEGICGMLRRSGCLYRPLLNVPPESLRGYLVQSGFTWREDATNQIADNPRNQMRLEVLPLIERFYPAAREAIARFASNAQVENEYLSRRTEEFFRCSRERGPWGQRLLLSDPLPEEAILRRAIRGICGRDLNSARLSDILALCRQERGKMSVFADLVCERTSSALYFLPSKPKIPEPVPFSPEGITLLSGICRIESGPSSEEPDYRNPRIEILDADALAGTVLRTRENGDFMYPLGAPGRRLLSDCLTDKKIDRPLRDFLPVLARGPEILWCYGAGISRNAALSTRTRRRLRLNIHLPDRKTGGLS